MLGVVRLKIKRMISTGIMYYTTNNIILLFALTDMYHIAEDELVLECRIRGQPLPAITWLKDGREIAASGRISTSYLADGVCRLTIDKPVPTDTGKYTCKAENHIWSDHISHDVFFTGTPNNINHPLVGESTKSQRDYNDPHNVPFKLTIFSYTCVQKLSKGVSLSW